MGLSPECEKNVASVCLPRTSDAEFLRGLVHGMRCGIVAVSRDGRLMMINQVAEQMLELESGPAPGAPIAEALAAYPRLAAVLRESFAMSSLPNRAELHLEPDCAGGKTIGFTISMIPGDDGQAIGAAMFFKDLTQIEHKAEQERLKDRLAALGEMAASMAHEIRNPLASIDVSCSLLRRKLRTAESGADGTGRQLLGKINDEVRRIDRTITSSLEYVRPLCLSLDGADLCEVLDEATTAAVQRCDRPGVRIVRRNLKPVSGFQMDRDQLRQVFENLIVNAIQAVEDHGTVTIEVETRSAPGAGMVPYRGEADRPDEPWIRFDQFAVIRISDTGPGVPAEDRSRIFFPFFTTKKQGSGVGLAMAKKIVTSHRGLVDVDSAPGGGALFTVRLPMVLDGAEDSSR